jgi:ferredoxin-NADP reductase
MALAVSPLELLVREMRWEADGIMSLVLADASGTSLPPWSPGAHVDVELPSGLVRQYSLCGDLADESSYRIAVLREERSRGGSREIFDTPLLGRTLVVHGPRNHFPLEPASEYLFIAGGIGITPILPMLGVVEATGSAWTLIYGGRSRSTMAFVPEISRGTHGEVHIVPQDEVGFPDIGKAIGDASQSAIYCCGPPGLLDAVQTICDEQMLAHRLHLERFVAPDNAPSDLPMEEFELELRRSGTTLRVPTDRTVLSIVREVVPSLLSSCEEGYCGTCEVGVLEGVPDHRDSVLSESERAANKSMMTCVSRSKTPRLVLDI